MFLTPMLERPEARWQLRDERNGAILASRLEAAFDSRSRRRGLLGRAGLEAGAALVVAPCNAIHTFFMRFPIDLLFVTRDGKIVKLRASLPAPAAGCSVSHVCGD